MQRVVLTKLGDRVSADRYLVLNAVAGNAAAADLTVELDTKNWSRLVLGIEFTRVAGTAVVLTPSYSLDGGGTYHQLTSTAVAGGAGTVEEYTDTRTVSATENFGVAYDVLGYDKFKIVFSVTSGGATDFLSVAATVAT